MNDIEFYVKNAMQDGVEFSVFDGQLQVRNWELEQLYTRKYLRENQDKVIRVVEKIKNEQNVRNKLNELIVKGIVFIATSIDAEIENLQLISPSDRAFLEQNLSEVLYLLQMAAIWKYYPDEFQSHRLKIAESPQQRIEITRTFFQQKFESDFD